MYIMYMTFDTCMTFLNELFCLSFLVEHRDLLENSSYANEPPCYKCTHTNGTECTPELTNYTDPLFSSASSTTASVTSLLIGQLVLLLSTVTLFDLPVGLA